MYKNTKKDIIHPQLSYKIVGCLIEVQKNLGSGHREKIYCNSLKEEFIKQNINFKEQIMTQIRYKDKPVGKIFLDFLIENKIILEIKVGSFFRKQHLDQILDYLKSSSLKLGIISNFTRNGVRFYRVLNIK